MRHKLFKSILRTDTPAKNLKDYLLMTTILLLYQEWLGIRFSPLSMGHLGRVHKQGEILELLSITKKLVFTTKMFTATLLVRQQLLKIWFKMSEHHQWKLTIYLAHMDTGKLHP
jgi:hypothetical protein